MAALKCESCSRYSFAEGCKLERSNYFQFRDCMLGRKDYRYPKEHTQNISHKARK